jgi:hypothetical protein
MAHQSGRSNRGNAPVVFNHNLMLKEIRDNLKHLRREPENPNETQTANGPSTQVTYRGNNISNSQNQHVTNNHQARFSHRNNFVEQQRGHHEHLQSNRNYDESGYSSSSSECSSQSANDFNGQLVGSNVEVRRFYCCFLYTRNALVFASKYQIGMQKYFVDFQTKPLFNAHANFCCL